MRDKSNFKNYAIQLILIFGFLCFGKNEIKKELFIKIILIYDTRSIYCMLTNCNYCILKIDINKQNYLLCHSSW